MSAPSTVYYFVRLPSGGQTNASSYASARIVAGMIPGAKVCFSHSERP